MIPKWSRLKPYYQQTGKDFILNATVTLSEYFLAVDKRIRMLAADQIILSVQVCGHLICQHFQRSEHAQQAIPSLTGIFTECIDDANADADFYYWIDGLNPYLPNGIHDGDWRDETGYLHIVWGYGLIGADYIRHRYYLCLEHPEDMVAMLSGHAMIISFFHWALRTGMMILHGAAVGAGGKGVLIGGRGGRGKSTLAVASLLRGMDFTADDYVLLNQQGFPVARPIYKTVSLNLDMAELLRPNLPVVRRDAARGGKMLLDASSYSYCENLPIHAIIFPEFLLKAERSQPIGMADVQAKRPEITPMNPGQALTQMVHSTVSQFFDVKNDTRIILMMLERLRHLPVYKMQLSNDPGENAMCLEQFLISEAFSHNSEFFALLKGAERSSQ